MRKRSRYFAREELKKSGYKVTPARTAIIDLLSNSKKHLSAEDIFLKIHNISPNIGLTTVYRTLEVLVETGMVCKLDFGDRRARYEFSQGIEKEKHHHHLVCTNCNRIIDYTDFIEDEIELLKKTEKGLSKKYKFEIKNHIIQFYGLCNECRKKII
ncbi:MAG: transcriptional repressor [Candidatus Omnitrophica bacterium]|nr:transcriptional repressor [Candidatus Omnitrophota bacterium]MBD3269754.1 transcriptional repressor [Candidatus Omnitrophota bacterium]